MGVKTHRRCSVCCTGEALAFFRYCLGEAKVGSFVSIDGSTSMEGDTILGTFPWKPKYGSFTSGCAVTGDFAFMVDDV